MRSLEHCPTAELHHARRNCAAHLKWAQSVEDQVSADVGRVVQVSESDLMARGIALDLLQMAKRIGPQCEAAKYKDLSGEENLTLDHIVTDDRRSHQALW